MAALDKLVREADPFANGSAFVDGEFCPVSEARLPITDLGFIRSDATYDVVHVWKGRFFRLDDHIERFLQSCAAVRLDTGHSARDLAGILETMVALSGKRNEAITAIVG